jgi:uncharacterized protein YjbI with pentapeptide repeats
VDDRVATHLHRGRAIAIGVVLAVALVAGVVALVASGDDAPTPEARGAAPEAQLDATAGASAEAQASAAKLDQVIAKLAEAQRARVAPETDPDASYRPIEPIEMPDQTWTGGCGGASRASAGTEPATGQLVLHFPKAPSADVLLIDGLEPVDLDACSLVEFWLSTVRAATPGTVLDDVEVVVPAQTAANCGRTWFGRAPADPALEAAIRTPVPGHPVLTDALNNYDRCGVRASNAEHRSVLVARSEQVLSTPGVCYRCDFNGLKIEGVSASSEDLTEVSRFPTSYLVDADLRNATVLGSALERLLVLGGTASGLKVLDSTIANTTWQYVNFGAAGDPPARFENVRLPGTGFAYLDLSNVQFAGTTFGDRADPAKRTELQCARLRDQVAFADGTFGLAPDLVAWWPNPTADDSPGYVDLLGVRLQPDGPCNRPYQGAVLPVASLRREHGVDYRGATFYVERQDAGVLAGADLTGAQLADSSFVGVRPDLTGTTLARASLDNVDLSSVQLAGADLSGATGTRLDLRRANLRGATLVGATLKRALLADADLADANLSEVVASSSASDAADFTGVYAHDARFGSIKATHVSFQGAHLYGDGASLAGAYLANANFDDAVLDGTDFAGADLTGAQAAGATCVACTFDQAKLSGMTLTGSVLYAAELQGVEDKASNATLTGSWLRAGPDPTWSSPIAAGEAAFEHAATAASQPDGGFDAVTCPDGSSATGTGCSTEQLVVKGDPSRACRAAGSAPCPWQVAELDLPDDGGGDPVAITRSPLSGSPVVLRSDGTLVVLGSTPKVVTLRGVQQPTAIAPAPQGQYYVADAGAHRVWLVDPVSGLASPFAGTGTAGSSGDGGPAKDATLEAPSALWVDGLGQLHIADAAAHRVRWVDWNRNIGTLIGTGADGSPTDGARADQAPISAPAGIVGDPWGAIYVADGTAAVYRIAPDGTVRRHAGTGTAGAPSPEVTGAQPALEVPLDQPGPLALAPVQSAAPSEVAAAATLLIADVGNVRLRPVSATGNLEASWIGDGDGDPADGGDASSAALGGPTGLFAESDGSAVYVVDAGADGVPVVLVLTPTGTSLDG